MLSKYVHGNIESMDKSQILINGQKRLQPLCRTTINMFYG